MARDRLLFYLEGFPARQPARMVDYWPEKGSRIQPVSACETSCAHGSKTGQSNRSHASQCQLIPIGHAFLLVGPQGGQGSGIRFGHGYKTYMRLRKGASSTFMWLLWILFFPGMSQLETHGQALTRNSAWRPLGNGSCCGEAKIFHSDQGWFSSVSSGRVANTSFH